MSYAIKILKEKADLHKAELIKMQERMINHDFELQGEYIFLESDIQNQKAMILDLVNAINKLK